MAKNINFSKTLISEKVNYVDLNKSIFRKLSLVICIFNFFIRCGNNRLPHNAQNELHKSLTKNYKTQKSIPRRIFRKIETFKNKKRKQKICELGINQDNITKISKSYLLNNIKSTKGKRNASKIEEYEPTGKVAFHKEQPTCNINYTYVVPKFKNIKKEIICNDIMILSKSTFNDKLDDAKTKSEDDFVKKCKAKCTIGDIRKGEIMTLEHIIAILLYTDFDELCYSFRKYWRTNENKNSNYGEYGNWGKFLFEVVNFFGTIQSKYITLYHGLNKKFLFSSLKLYPGPFSTTTSYKVSKVFRASKEGMILCISTNNRYMDVSYLSKFNNEEEYLFMNTHQRLVNIVYEDLTSHIPHILNMLIYLFEGKIMPCKTSEQENVFKYINWAIDAKELDNLDETDQMICYQIEHMLYRFDNFIILIQTINIIKDFLDQNRKSIPPLLLDFDNSCYGSKILNFAHNNEKGIYYFNYDIIKVKNKNGRYVLGYKTLNITQEDGLDYSIFILVEYIIDDEKLLLYGHQVVKNCYNHLNIQARFLINGHSFSNDNTFDRHFLNESIDKILGTEIDIKYLLYYEKKVKAKKSKKIKSELIKFKLDEVKPDDTSKKFHKYYLNSLYFPKNEETQCFNCKLNLFGLLDLFQKYKFVNYIKIKLLESYKNQDYIGYAYYSYEQLQNELSYNKKNLNNVNDDNGLPCEKIKTKPKICNNRENRVIYNQFNNRFSRGHFVLNLLNLIYMIYIKNLFLYIESCFTNRPFTASNN